MELKNQTVVARVGPERMVQRHNLALVSAGKVEFSPTRFGAARATAQTMFTSAEMRHNFAIWAVKNNADKRGHHHLYYCIRCKQAFSVNDSSGAVSLLDSQRNALQGSEAIKRLGTFRCGPCAAFTGFMGVGLTSKIIPIHSARGRLTYLAAAGRRAWRALMAHWRRLPTNGSNVRGALGGGGDEHEAAVSR
jgi:hypothetical protein